MGGDRSCKDRIKGVDTVEQQISIAMRKGGITPGSSINLYRFEVKRHY
jgi:hypothetical protein